MTEHTPTPDERVRDLHHYIDMAKHLGAFAALADDSVGAAIITAFEAWLADACFGHTFDRLLAPVIEGERATVAPARTLPVYRCCDECDKPLYPEDQVTTWINFDGKGHNAHFHRFCRVPFEAWVRQAHPTAPARSYYGHTNPTPSNCRVHGHQIDDVTDRCLYCNVHMDDLEVSA